MYSLTVCGAVDAAVDSCTSMSSPEALATRWGLTCHGVRSPPVAQLIADIDRLVWFTATPCVRCYRFECEGKLCRVVGPPPPSEERVAVKLAQLL